MEAGKREFRFTYDEEFTVWMRRHFIVEANTVEEAQEIVRKIRDKHIRTGDWQREMGDTFNLWDADSDMMYDTMEETGAIEIRSWENDEVIISTVTED